MNRREALTATAASAITLTTPLPLVALGGMDFPYNKQRMAVLGHDMAYVDEGTGDPVVFLHGNPTSSYLWRNIMPALADSYRIIAPDLIGMGDSGKPDIAYTYPDHAAHLHGLLDALNLQNVTLMIHATPGALIPPAAADDLQANLKNLTSVDVGTGTHFLQEDQPDAIADALVACLPTL